MQPKIDEARLVQTCQALLRRRSLPGEEGQVAQFLAEEMRARGFDAVWIDDVGNVIGKVSGQKPGKSLLFDGHMDTIGVTDPTKWRHDPFGGEIEDGRIYGRGAADMKGALAAMIEAGTYWAEHRAELAGNVYISGSVSEELVEGPALAKVLEAVRPDYVVIGEATNLDLNIGQRGRAEVILRTLGIPAHSSSPHLGVNAVKKMARALQILSEMTLGGDELLGPAIIEVTDIISTPYPGISVLPDRCQVTLDRRLLPGENEEGVLKEIAAALAQEQARDKDFRFEVEIAQADFVTYTGFRLQARKFAPAWKMALRHPLVRAAYAGLKEVGLEPRFSAYSFCTNGSASAGRLGLPTIGFGPGRESEAHTIDEYLELESLLGAARGYIGLIGAILREGTGNGPANGRRRSGNNEEDRPKS